MMNYLVRQ
jgi:hypothetical protein